MIRGNVARLGGAFSVELVRGDLARLATLDLSDDGLQVRNVGDGAELTKQHRPIAQDHAATGFVLDRNFMKAETASGQIHGPAIVEKVQAPGDAIKSAKPADCVDRTDSKLLFIAFVIYTHHLLANVEHASPHRFRRSDDGRDQQRQQKAAIGGGPEHHAASAALKKSAGSSLSRKVASSVS